MKRRNGFVSNSSSSSFIVNLGRKMPKTVEEMKKALKLTDYKIGENYFDVKEEDLSKVFEILFNTLCDEKKRIKSLSALKKKLLNELQHEAYYSYRDVAECGYAVDDYGPDGLDKKMTQKERMKLFDLKWKRSNKRCREIAQKMLEESTLMKDFDPTKDVVVKVEIGDEDGRLFGFIEHGDLLDNAKHVRHSHH